VTYSPSRGYTGNDAFELRTDDTKGASSDLGKVSISVISSPPSSNLPPIAESQSIKAEQNEQQEILLRGSDPDDEKLTFSLVTEPAHGMVNAFDPLDGKLVYIAKEKFTGVDSFTFRIIDPNGATSNIGKISITVIPSTTLPTGDQNSRPGHDDISMPEEKIKPPVSRNHRPLADAGPDSTVYEGEKEVTLKGTAIDPDGDLISYFWKQTSGPRVELNGVNTDSISFNAPTLHEDVVLKFRLHVIDDKRAEDVDEIKINVKHIDLMQEDHEFTASNVTR